MIIGLCIFYMVGGLFFALLGFQEKRTKPMGFVGLICLLFGVASVFFPQDVRGVVVTIFSIIVIAILVIGLIMLILRARKFPKQEKKNDFKFNPDAMKGDIFAAILCAGLCLLQLFVTLPNLKGFLYNAANIAIGIFLIVLTCATFSVLLPLLGSNEKKKYKISYAIVTVIVTLSMLTNTYATFFGENGYFASSSWLTQKSSDDEDEYGNTESTAFFYAKEAVKDRLKSPSSANFCSIYEADIHRSGNTWTVKGWVEADNSFGAKLRNGFTVKIKFTGRSTHVIEVCNIN